MVRTMAPPSPTPSSLCCGFSLLVYRRHADSFCILMCVCVCSWQNGLHSVKMCTFRLCCVAVYYFPLPYNPLFTIKFPVSTILVGWDVVVMFACMDTFPPQLLLWWRGKTLRVSQCSSTVIFSPSHWVWTAELCRLMLCCITVHHSAFPPLLLSISTWRRLFTGGRRRTQTMSSLCCLMPR